MKLPWKLLSLVGTVTVVFAACSQSSPVSPSALSSTSDAAAALSARGNGAPKGKLVYNWNLIGTPGDYDGGCGNGHRVFVQRDAKNEHILFQDHDDGWHIEQCDATFGDTAVIHTDELGKFDVYARILGKPNGSFFACAQTVEDYLSGETLCLLGTIDLKRDGGRSRFAVQPDTLFDAELEDIIWSVETNADFRIVQFRVYQQ